MIVSIALLWFGMLFRRLELLTSLSHQIKSDKIKWNDALNSHFVDDLKSITNTPNPKANTHLRNI